MENASKALIIAGAILLAIVIISLGLVVINNSRSVTDDTNLNEQEKQSFNAKFVAYEGNSVSGSRVNSLIQQVISTNQSMLDQGKATAANSGNFSNFVHIVFPSVSRASNTTNKYEYIAGIMTDGKICSTGVASETSATPTANWGALTNSTAVNTGKTYTVKIASYENGLVHKITVKAN